VSLSPHLLSVAENANTHSPLGPRDERIENERFVLWMGPGVHPSWNVAQRLRLTPETIDTTLEEVHALLRERNRSACTWEVGSSATPPDLAEQLRTRGLVDDRDPYVAGMVLTEPPPAQPEGIEAREARDFEDFKAANRVAEQAFGGDVGMDDEQLRARYDEKLATGGWKTFVALVDGEIIGSATSTYVDGAVTLNGGAVLPHARGRGAYRALVAARWADALERGTPALVTQAGAMSKPILERLGFRMVAEITILLDEFGA
jgi:GNAT superfamily N-acetyltransferase